VRTTLIVALLALSAPGAFAQDSSRAGVAAATHTTASNAESSKAHILTREELDKLLARPQNLLVIDVRRPDEISQIGGLPVYLNVQINDLEKSVAWIPKGRTIITVSNHAKRAGTAADLLSSKGFKVAGAVGVQTYEEAGGKLTKVVPPPARTANTSPNG